ncbi:Cellulase [Apiospora arundinis]
MSTAQQQELPRPKPSRQHMTDAAAAVALALDGKIQYALVGSGACSVLGSQQVTENLEIVVPKGQTQQARSLLKEHPTSFDIEKRTLHTYFKSSSEPSNGRVRVELLAPPGMFREEYTESTPTILAPSGDKKIRVLKPTLLLNSRCASVQDQRTEEGKRAHAMDIVFLLGWCHRNGVVPTSDEVPHATMPFVHTFISLLPSSKEHWVNSGYDLVRVS